jgi:hypothetical protein
VNTTRLWLKALTVAGGLTLIAGAVVTGFVAAQTSGGDINSCVKESNGNVRIVESAADCKQQEFHLSWPADGSGGGGDVLDTGLTSDCAVGTIPVVCVARDLPAGTWVLQYRGVYEHASAAITNMNPTCTLSVDGNLVDSFSGRFGANGDMAILFGSIDTSALASVTVTCESATPFTMESQRMQATGVGSVTVWSP